MGQQTPNVQNSSSISFDLKGAALAFWGEYVSVAARQAKASKVQARLRKRGIKVDPVEIEGRTIALV